MTRGFFNTLLSVPGYRDAKKTWHITLERSDFFWYELVVNPPSSHDTKQNIANYLNELRAGVEATLEKRFIYFYISRKKVRFDTARPPKYSLFGGSLKINLIVGGKDRRKISVPLPKVDGRRIKPTVSVDERFIYFQTPTISTIASVHEFLQLNKLSLGIASEVQYVGITKDPAQRTLSREHRGYADAIYFAPTSENDIFLAVNTFKVMSDTTTEDGGFRIVSANSMTDEIPAGHEGLVIENALIHYFDTKAQESDKISSWTKFKNLLNLTLGAKNINSVSIHMELEDPSEYDALGSRGIKANTSHSLVWGLKDGEPKLTKFGSEEELRAYRDHGKDAYAPGK
jgi:hypothetical protein